MNIANKEQAIVEQLITAYLRRFPLYKSKDFEQDVWLSVLEKSTKIKQRYNSQKTNKVPFESYWARAVWNICIDLGKRKYATFHQRDIQKIGIEQVGEPRRSQDSPEEGKEEMLQRLQKALASKRLKKVKPKIELFMQLKVQKTATISQLQYCFPTAKLNQIQTCLAQLKLAQTEKEVYEAIALVSGKKAETEQRWFNYQIDKIRGLVNH